MKPGNNHIQTVYSKTKEIKKFLEIMSKLHQEHSKTSNKDMINMENNILQRASKTKKQSQ